MRPYQVHGVEHVMRHPYCGLFFDMGLGKTCTTLTALDELLFADLSINRVLVVAPKKVAEDTWVKEAGQWEHLRHLRISKVLGTEAQRIKALHQDADIWVINRENIPWLVTHYGGQLPFDCLVVDELTSFKSPTAKRFKALRMVRPLFKRVIGLTGTPAPNGLLDLWAQLYLIDQGERLGKTITAYRDNYFTPGRRNGHVVFEYKLRNASESEKAILSLISDVCISMKASDYLDLPKRLDLTREIDLPTALKKRYTDFERDLVLGLVNDSEITAANAMGLTNKLRQFANGAVYDENHEFHEIHDEKLEALAEEIEAANGEPVLIFYQFQSDVARIMKRLKEFKPLLLKDSADIDKWNSGVIKVMLAHAKSAGHGLNLQYGGNIIVWFGLDFALELYLQAVGRLDRQGQTKPVRNIRLIVKDSIEGEVLQALEDKRQINDAVMEAVKVRILKHKKQSFNKNF